MAQDKVIVLGRDENDIIRILELDADGKLILAGDSVIQVADPWTLALVSDTGTNDNDKALTVPAGYEWQILSLFVSYTADGNAGDRQLEVSVRDGADNVVFQVRPGATQAVSEVRYYTFAPSMADLTDFRDTDLMTTPLPPTLFLPANYDVRVRDNNNVSAGDDMIIRLLVAARAIS